MNTDPTSPSYRTQQLAQAYNSKDPRSYPLSYYDYLIVPTEIRGIFTAAKGASLGAFASYTLCAGQNEAAALGYAPLPINVAADGDLSISFVPGAIITFADPELVNGVSVTRGTLPDLTVADNRFFSQPGWDLTANIADFVNDADPSTVIGNARIGFAAHLVSSTGSGVLIAPPQIGGAAHYPTTFASSPTLTGTGTTVLSEASA